MKQLILACIAGVVLTLLAGCQTTEHRAMNEADKKVVAIQEQTYVPLSPLPSASYHAEQQNMALEQQTGF